MKANFNNYINFPLQYIPCKPALYIKLQLNLLCNLLNSLRHQHYIFNRRANFLIWYSLHSSKKITGITITITTLHTQKPMLSPDQHFTTLEGTTGLWLTGRQSQQQNRAQEGVLAIFIYGGVVGRVKFKPKNMDSL